MVLVTEQRSKSCTSPHARPHFTWQTIIWKEDDSCDESCLCKCLFVFAWPYIIMCCMYRLSDLLDYLSKCATPADCYAAESRMYINTKHAPTNDVVCGLCHKEATFSLVVAFEFYNWVEAWLAGGKIQHIINATALITFCQLEKWHLQLHSSVSYAAVCCWSYCVWIVQRWLQNRRFCSPTQVGTIGMEIWVKADLFREQ